MKKLITFLTILCFALPFGGALAQQSTSANHTAHSSKLAHKKHAKKLGAHKKSSHQISHQTPHKKHKKQQA